MPCLSSSIVATRDLRSFCAVYRSDLRACTANPRNFTVRKITCAATHLFVSEKPHLLLSQSRTFCLLDHPSAPVTSRRDESHVKISARPHRGFSASCSSHGIPDLRPTYFPMDKSELPKTVTTILNGHNYLLWSQDMRSFLKGHRLWRYVTGEIQAPVRSKDEDDTKFADRLKDWDCKNHQIITWFRHSTISSSSAICKRLDNRSSVMPRFCQLLSHETHLSLTLQTHHPDAVLATAARPSSSSSSRSEYYKNCHKQGHLLSECPTIQCRIVTRLVTLSTTALPSLLSQVNQSSSKANHSVAAAAEDSLDPSLLSVLLFSYFIPTTHAPLIQTANGLHIAASHTGSVSTPILSLSDIYLIPNFTLNLISIGQLCELGFDLWFGSSSCRVQDPRTNQVLGTGHKVGQMFELTSLHLPSTPTPPPSHIAHTASVFLLSLWHLRLGLNANTATYLTLLGLSSFLLHVLNVFWGEAALTAVYTINRLPSSALQNVTPFKRLYGTPASYSSLCFFGCACFVLLQLHEHSKLEPRSHLCCFLGYGIEHKGYRCWDPISQRLRISRHVVFWEHTTFNSLSKFKTCSTPSFFTNPSLPLFPHAISPADSPVSPLAPPLAVDPILDQTILSLI
uniref:Uncharacterized protein n=1 Tax=Fagus sylvatica TaxID=28930 RepID=A0A2N9J177_FAGSY